MSENLDDLKSFIIVAQTRSFTKAAGQLGVSQSALSYTLKMLEQRLGIKLLNRTTRSVSLTQEGEQLLNDIEPLITGIEQKLYNLNEFRDSPRGKLRINGTEISLNFLLWDKLSKFSHDHPNIQLELTMDYAFTDIVKDRYDIGIRLGENVHKDMISVKVSHELEMMTLASPAYLHTYGAPQIPDDLHQHRCIGLRLPSHERIQSWEFKNSQQNSEIQTLSPEFSMVVSHARLQLKAGLDGLGIVWLPKIMVEAEIQKGNLVTVLKDWDMSYSGYYMYYPSRRESSPLFRLLVEALRL
ncbi:MULTISPECIES: LysR family transcriptional regulator [Acinetobacter]|uniref:LysR family transcriptional regulator n=1 Tax=Acinetobacter TaxID=469 RepID=UPI0008CAF39C|nr:MULTISPECIES: LysR family transcriptional regulator [Acinetobacter]MBJ9705389.1 LysR family transcriptional regulator [Acinetobacter calcoaceticus]SEO17250.1 DNA-binding transcriptional regulator, LysR family [Acinetobacter sp. yr461]